MALGSLWARVMSRPTFARSFSPLARFSPFTRQFTRYLFGFATWIPVLIVFNANVAEITLINGPSMMPYLNSGYNETLRRDVCLTWKFLADSHLHRGMVVTFRSVPGVHY